MYRKVGKQREILQDVVMKANIFLALMLRQSSKFNPCISYYI